MPFYLMLLHAALMTALSAITPVILLLLAVGLATAIFQAMFQIEDTAFALLPKILAMICIALSGGFGALQLFEALSISWIGHAGAWVHLPWF
jgi:flagellar biosynthesis protein FliQ